MRRFRHAVNRILTAAGPGLLLVGTVCAAGLALHAADDWHHHGEMGAGFFHLHFHVGDHHHPDLEGHEAGHVHHQASHESTADGPADADAGVDHSDVEIPDGSHPAPADSDRKRHLVLTVSHAVNQLSQGAPRIAEATAAPEVVASSRALPTQTCWQDRIADPRGPPA